MELMQYTGNQVCKIYCKHCYYVVLAVKLTWRIELDFVRSVVSEYSHLIFCGHMMCVQYPQNNSNYIKALLYL